jgi:toxin ParE1/3/4
MTRVELAPELAEDFERIIAHLAEHENAELGSRIHDIIAAIDVLQRNPLIGRRTAGDNRELIIGRGSRGYVALYRYVAAIDTVLVLALRGQRESGYGDV